MIVVWTEKGLFRNVSYTNESDFEQTVIKVQQQLFGPNRLYLDVKKKIGGKGNKQNIP